MFLFYLLAVNLIVHFHANFCANNSSREIFPSPVKRKLRVKAFSLQIQTLVISFHRICVFTYNNPCKCKEKLLESYGLHSLPISHDIFLCIYVILEEKCSWMILCVFFTSSIYLLISYIIHKICVIKVYLYRCLYLLPVISGKSICRKALGCSITR